MDNNIPVKSCNCTPVPETVLPADRTVSKTVSPLRSILLSIGIAFFPKCPMCWAAYMSMFGSIGLTNVPYMKWMLPVLMAFLALHLYLLFRRVKDKGYGPFVCSLAGALLILTCKMTGTEQKALLLTGILLIFAGSLWNSFAGRKGRVALLH